MSRIIRILGGLSLILAVKFSYAMTWNDLWYNSNQQARKLLQQHPESAAELFSDSRWKGVAYFNSHNYQAATDSFSQDKTSDGFYNQGNSLAYQNKFPEAIKAYQEALKLNPQNQDAQHNLDLIKKLQQQQQSQAQQNQKNSQTADDSKNKNSAENNSDKNSQSDKSPANNSGQSGQNSPNQAQKNNSAQDGKSGEQQKGQAGNNSSGNQTNKPSAAQSQQSAQSGNNSASPQKNNSANQAQPNANSSPAAADSRASKATSATQPHGLAQQAASAKPDKNSANSDGIVATTGNSTQKMTPEDREVAAVLSQIPDDPGGLLRNKFLRDYQNQQAQGNNNGQ